MGEDVRKTPLSTPFAEHTALEKHTLAAQVRGMLALERDSLPPPPLWLTRLTLVSVTLALLAFGALLWAKWAVVLAMGQDVIKFCF